MHEPDTTQWTSEWAGEWIRTADPGEGDDVSGPRRVGFRREFELTAVPVELPIRVSADSRYVLWVNGTELGRGPIRSQPYRWTYDEYDLAPALGPGTNVIAVLVTYYGADNAFWQRARVTDGLGADACLILDAPARWHDVVTAGDRWTAHPFDAWSTVPGRGVLAALPIEVVDQRRLDDGWLRPAGAPEWKSAEPAQALHAGGGRRSRPPAYPYGALRPRGLAQLRGDTVTAQLASVGRARPSAEPDPVEVVLDALDTLDPDPLDLGDPVLWQFDFGRIVAGYVEIDFDAPAGTVFDVAYLERPATAPTSGDRRYVPRAGARVIAAGGAATFRALEPNGLRIAAILARAVTAAPVRVTAVRVREHLYPFSGGAFFSSNEKELVRLWNAGVRTVEVNSSDAFTDCPTREQRAWVGDAVVHVGVHLVANEDWRLIERHLELSDSPRPDGLLPMSVAGDIESAARYSIPDWSLHWLHALTLYARASKRVEFVRRRLATARRILEWFETYADDHGVLVDVPEWPLGDWSSVFTSGCSALLTALWARGLREFTELSEWVGNAADARRTRALVACVERGFECFWDDARGLYVDHIVSGERRPAVSQVSNAAAIVAGMVPDQRRAGVVARMTDEDRLVTRGWNAPSPTVGLEQKVRDRAEGVQRIDWDVERQIVRAEPFFSSVVHDAVACAGRADLLPVALRRWSNFLTDGYDTFGECWEWGTPAHGWSSTPTRDLIVHVLGVEALSLWEETYRLAPARTGIHWMRAAVPTTAGLMDVELNGAELVVDTPVPVRIETWSSHVLDRPAGRYRVNLEERREPA
ncbi:family 78 glycoside hydrolase catalytic domain [Phytoactinopolyspora endophytica]|uniref:alpha-L-rhamnosidase-related protein n=1 Tax=Phytoactinopolyspora endophytica TaxID=1642495 RepID=UPI00101C8A21|nr:family 78 glycoside hydrolase catalytic domain [Phytoactinopolyspora endophytica]